MKKNVNYVAYICVIVLLFANITVYAVETDNVPNMDNYGYLPRPVEIIRGNETIVQGRSLLNAVYSDSSYDLRTLGLVSPVKNQKLTGTCWTFAGMSVFESAMLKNNIGNTYDYSECHLNHALSNTHPLGFDRPLNGGGYFEMVMAYLSRGGGPVLERSDPFGSVSPDGIEVARAVSITDSKTKEKLATKMYELPNLSFSNTTGEATYIDAQRQQQIIDTKKLIIDYGVVNCSYYTNDKQDTDAGISNYNASNTAYYYPKDGAKTSNHAVSIVGWDDNYSSANFKITPPGNGAFLIKNSWGTNWGDAGYFWLSYYDKYVAHDVSCIAEVKNVKEYDNIYYYDTFGVTGGYGFSGTTVVGANKFTTNSQNEILKAVGFNTTQGNTAYEIYININSKAINSSTLIKVDQGNLLYAGYHTIPIPNSVINGSEFAVAVKLINAGNSSNFFPIEAPNSGTFSTKATSNSGEGYVYSYIPSASNESKWYDMYDTNKDGIPENKSVCIKAFTDKATPSVSFYNGNDEVITSSTDNETVKSFFKVRGATANTRAVLATYQGNKLFNIEYKTDLTNNAINSFTSTLPSGTGYTFKTLLIDENTLKPSIKEGYTITK